MNAIDREVAASLGAPEALRQVLPRLVEGLGSLGSDPRLIVRELRRAGVGPADRVIDLACGHGEAAVMAARDLGCRITGVDAAAEFIAAARRLARGAQARFRVGDARRITGTYDAGMMIGWLPLATGAALLRRLVKPGGTYLIDDCVRGPGRPPTELRGTPTRSQGARIIAGLGDSLERMVLVPRLERLHAALLRRLRANAAALERERPGLRRELQGFIETQERAQRALGGSIRPALWVVRRG